MILSLTKTVEMKKIHPRITCCYLYTISRYGYPPKAGQTLTYLREFEKLGFTSVELEGIREPHLNKMYDMREHIRAEVKSLELKIPYFCAVLPGLSSNNHKESEKSLALFDKGCQIASHLGALGVLDNAPLPPYQFPEDIPIVRHYDETSLNKALFPSDLTWSAYWDKLIATYRQACDIAASYNLTYQMHPAHGVLASTTDAFLYFKEAVGRDNLRFNFDTANQFFLKDNLMLSLRRLAGHIDYIHLSDNSGLRIEHLPIGKGRIPWKSFFETLHLIGFDGHFGIDIGGAESNVENLEEAYLNAANFISKHWNDVQYA